MPELRVSIQSSDRMDAHIELPEDLVLSLGAGKRPAVRTEIEGVRYQTRVAVYGGRYYLGLRKDVVKAASLTPGKSVRLAIELDDQPREVELPPDLSQALTRSEDAKSAFDRLSFTHRKEYVRWVEEAKREETRRTRVEKTISMLRDGVKTPG